MCKWLNASFTRVFRVWAGEGGCEVEENMRSRVEQRSGMLKCCKGSMRMMEDEGVGVESAVAMMRVRREVFPEPES